MKDCSLYVLRSASKQQLDAIFTDAGLPLHVCPLSDVALCLLLYYLLLFILCLAGHLSPILCCCYLLGFLWWLTRLRNGRIERSIRANMNYKCCGLPACLGTSESSRKRCLCIVKDNHSEKPQTMSCYKNRNPRPLGMESEHRVWFFAIPFVSIVMNC